MTLEKRPSRQNHATRRNTRTAYAASPGVTKPRLSPSLVYHVHNGPRNLLPRPLFGSRLTTSALEWTHRCQLISEKRLDALARLTPTAG
jgi:hypothetical protein